MRTRIPIEAPPEQRFLRSRQNLRVRKVRRVRNFARGLVIVAVNVVVLLALLHGVRRALEAVVESAEFSLTSVEIRGNHRVSSDRIETRLAPWAGRSLLAIDLAETEAEVEQEPWVLDASVRRILPHTLVVNVRERVPAALALVDGRVLLVDATGHAIGPIDDGFVDSLPVLTGLEGKNPALLAARLAQGVAALAAIERTAPPFARAVSELDLSASDRIALRTVDGGPWILLDPTRVERNLSAYLDLRGEIDRLTGPVSAVDLRWRDRITLTPATPTPTGEHG